MLWIICSRQNVVRFIHWDRRGQDNTAYSKKSRLVENFSSKVHGFLETSCMPGNSWQVHDYRCYSWTSTDMEVYLTQIKSKQQYTKFCPSNVHSHSGTCYWTFQNGTFQFFLQRIIQQWTLSMLSFHGFSFQSLTLDASRNGYFDSMKGQMPSEE